MHVRCMFAEGRSARQGPQVEDALYAYGTKAQSAATTFDAPSWSHVLQAYHAARIDDQFVPPLVRVDGAGRPLGIVKVTAVRDAAGRAHRSTVTRCRRATRCSTLTSAPTARSR